MKKLNQTNSSKKKIKDDKRTDQQNRAMHKYFELVAEALNNAGYDIEEVLSYYRVDIEWTKESVKEILWRPVQRSMFKKESTTQLKSFKEIDRIYDVINRFLAKLKIETIPFPSVDSEMDELKNFNPDHECSGDEVDTIRINKKKNGSR